MAKLTKEQKAEMAKLKAIPNDAMKEAIAGLNEFLKANEIEVMKKAKSKGEAVKLFTDAINDLIENDKAADIPEKVAQFFNDHIVGEDVADGAPEETSKGDKPKKTGKPRKTKVEIQVRYDAISDMIKTGKYTKKEIVDAIVPKFPEVTESTISTFVQDCMNKKYNKLPALTIKGEDGKLSFKK